MRSTALSVALAFLAACGSTVPETQSERDTLARDCEATISRFTQRDAGLRNWFEKRSYGYAVFPSVGKAAIGVGGAYGRGQVYEQGEMVGYSTLTQGTVGLQLGGQAYSEVIFFKDKLALDLFKRGNYEFSAQASAVAVSAGASADADYEGGVAIFTMTQGGLMAEASIGGQKFSYEAP